MPSRRQGNVDIAAGQIWVYDPSGKLIETIEVPERPLQLVFGGPDRKTLFVCGHVALRGAYPQRRTIVPLAV